MKILHLMVAIAPALAALWLLVHDSPPVGATARPVAPVSIALAAATAVTGTVVPTSTVSAALVATPTITRTTVATGTVMAALTTTPVVTATARISPTATPVPTGTPTPAPARGAIPSASMTEGRFVGLAGEGLQTLTRPAKYWIAVAAGGTSFNVEVFDGDLGGLWDNHDPLNSVHVQYQLFADPRKSGNPAGKPLIASGTSSSMADNAWTSLYNGPIHASAQATTGHFFYLLLVQWNDSSRSANEFNAFKLRTTGRQLTITAGQWAFVGAPINLGADPALGSPGNTYNGEWNWYMFVPPGNANASFTECDADFRGDPSSPGNPPDDEPNDPRVRIPPNVRYTIFRPDGQIFVHNLTPSGNLGCLSRSGPIAAGGPFRWNWNGVDAHNVIFVISDYESLSVAETPLEPGPEPTMTPPPTPTSPPPPPPEPEPEPPPPSPTPTPTPTPTEVPTEEPTVEPTEVPVEEVPVEETPEPEPVPVQVLPRAGGSVLEAYLVMALAMVIMAAGVFVGKRARGLRNKPPAD